MESPYFIFGVLVVITGFFLAIAMSIQFCACVKAFRRIQREKARLREIQEAATQPPPPYALVVSSCHTSDSMHHPHFPSSDGNICCFVGTINNPHHQHGTIMTPGSANFVPYTNTICSCSSRNVVVETSSAQAEVRIDCDNWHKSIDTESPPTYEEAVRIEKRQVL